MVGVHIPVGVVDIPSMLGNTLTISRSYGSGGLFQSATTVFLLTRQARKRSGHQIMCLVCQD